MANEWLDKMLGNKISKEALESQGTDKQDHFERKVQAHDWIKGVTELDPTQVEAEYRAQLEAEAKMLGKTAALDDVVADGTTPEEVVNRDYKRDVSSLSDYALAELLAEARGHKAQNTNEMYYELKEKAKAEVASSREKAEKALLEMIPDNAQLDWQKAFKEYKKEEKPADPKEKDLYKSDVPEKGHDFEHPAEDKFKVPSDEKKADVMIGVGREADERKEVTQEAGVLKKDITEGLGKDASLKCAHCGHCPEDKKEVEAKTPPGAEHAVKELKKNPEVDNPWAVAWSMKNKGDKFKKADYDQPRNEVYPKTADGDSEALRAAFQNTIQGAGEEIIIDLLMRYMPEDEMREMLNDFSDEGVWSPNVEDYEHAGIPTAVSKLLVHLTKKASGCPVCGNAGEDLKNNEKEHLACKACGITYAEARLVNKQSNEIKSQASKEEVIKKVAELSKKAEVPSPWTVTTDENGQEVIARTEQPTNVKESKEDKTEELSK